MRACFIQTKFYDTFIFRLSELEIEISEAVRVKTPDRSFLVISCETNNLKTKLIGG